MNLIVGGTGFIGGHLAEYFFSQGEISKAIVRKGSFIRILDQCGVQNYEGDILQRSTLHEPLHDVEVVYNLALTTAEDDHRETDGEGLRNLLEESKEHGVKAFVHLSALDVYGFSKPRLVGEDTALEAKGRYQAAKLRAERILQDFADDPGMKVSVVRAARAVGARDVTLSLPILQMAENGKITLPTGGRMSFTHPKDIAQAMYKAAGSHSERGLYLVKSFDATVSELAAAITSSCGMRAEIRSQGVFSHTLLPRYTVEQIKGGLSIGNQKSWERIGYSPQYDLDKTSREIAEWRARELWTTEGRR